MSVAVVGAGIAGLTVAYRLMRAGIDTTVFERSSEVGGNVRRPVPVGELRLDPGPDSFLARKPWAVELCRELGLTLEHPAEQGAFLWTDEGLVRFLRDTAFGIPGDVGDVFRWPGLSRAGRWRAAQDLVRRPRKERADETLGSLLRRRLGDEATDLAVAPLLAGLHAGDVDRLSARATFPELVEWEREQGSLVRGAQAALRAVSRDAAGPVFVRPVGGIHRLPEALADALGERVEAETNVGTVGHVGSGFELVDVEGGVHGADAVVLATDPSDTAVVLEDLAPDGLRRIRGVTTAVVFLVYAEGTLDALPDGTGFVVPRGKAPMTACTWISRKWPNPAFGSRAVVRCFVGSDGDEDVVESRDEELVAACARFLSAALDLPPEPEPVDQPVVYRWPRAMPQYEPGHRELVRRIREQLPTGIFVCGNAFDGVGIADTVRGATETAERVAAHLREEEPSR
jgi:oxygen-dependent protoporphyrinogen oxidase